MDLGGHFLIAMPTLGDPRFDHSLVLIATHSPEGTMGFILNKPLPELRFDSLLDQIGIAHGNDLQSPPVHYGGPIEQGRGFVLHEQDWMVEGSTLPFGDHFALTASQEVLSALATGQGPTRALLALGYAGWGPGQLEAEIKRNDWLTTKADVDLAFDPDNGGKWAQALAILNISPSLLSATAGRA